MIMIRAATHRDIPPCLRHLELFARSFPAQRSLWPGIEEAEAVLRAMVERDDFIVLVAELEIDPVHSEVVGLIAGVCSTHFFNPAITVCTELFWWVDPPYRGTRAGAMLLEAYLQTSCARADWNIFTLERNSPVRDETLLRRGFVPTERNFLYERGDDGRASHDVRLDAPAEGS